MGFDLSSVINKATEVTENVKSGGMDGGHKLVYPGPGLLKVKLLYNPKSNLVARQIRRHRVGNTSATCPSMYGVECPICKSVDAIKNATGADLWKYKAKSRGVSYAQYVGSQDYKWDVGREPEVGEFILLMYPWTIYQEINRIIASAGPQADRLIALNEGKVLNISRWTESGQVKYKCEVDAFSQDFKSCDTDQEFEDLLNNSPDLSEAVSPPTITPEVTKIAMDLSQSLNRDYLKTELTGIPTQEDKTKNTPISGQPTILTAPDGSVFELVEGNFVPVSGSNEAEQSPPWSQDTETAPDKQESPPTSDDSKSASSNKEAPTTVSGDNDLPKCMGNHQDGNPECLACVHEMQCMLLQE